MVHHNAMLVLYLLQISPSSYIQSPSDFVHKDNLIELIYVNNPDLECAIRIYCYSTMFAFFSSFKDKASDKWNKPIGCPFLVTSKPTLSQLRFKIDTSFSKPFSVFAIILVIEKMKKLLLDSIACK